MAEERITTFTWHADRNLPLTITRPGASGAPATNKFTYDSNGNLLKLQENFGTPLVRTTRFTWNSHGQMMSIDGPRTDVADTASFAWLPASSGGFLSTVTNGKGHVTQFENYNAFGKPGKITDTNNIVTTFTSMS
ncbi:MAG: hypothetical protein CSB33_00240 [Desulfobacterales bacterium]|nr:MAG: hypothetical protein CSB33_00240 [Desulfobacterales bacterium]